MMTFLTMGAAAAAVPALALSASRVMTRPSGVRAVYPDGPIPSTWRGGGRIFLATSTAGWRAQAISLLERHGFRGYVFIPCDDGDSGVGWELAAAQAADVRLFWMPSGAQLSGSAGWWLARDPRSIVLAFQHPASVSAFVRHAARVGGARLMTETTLEWAIRAALDIAA